MSITTCPYCDKWIDEDFDAEHEEICKEENEQWEEEHKLKEEK